MSRTVVWNTYIYIYICIYIGVYYIYIYICIYKIVLYNVTDCCVQYQCVSCKCHVTKIEAKLVEVT